jgi:hypothetical protein
VVAAGSDDPSAGFEMQKDQMKSPPEHDSDGLNWRRRETQPTPQLGEIYCLYGFNDGSVALVAAA